MEYVTNCNQLQPTDVTIPDVLPEYECDHNGVDSGGTDYYGTSNPPRESDWNYPFCPKCGEKL